MTIASPGAVAAGAPVAAHAVPALAVRGLRKSYPGVRAVDGVSLTVGAGRVHGLVGENGAGKSTLMKMIAGAIAEDEGEILVWGVPVGGGDPKRSSAAGVATIYQELTIVPDMTAQSNVLLGRLPTRFGIVDRRRAAARYRAAAEAVGTAVPASALAGTLSTAAQQLLEIMRAVDSGHRLVMMDEPTASLGPEDIAHLHEVIRGLKAEGCGIVYVSHDLDAVLEVCDEVTVLREGAVVESRPADAWTKPGLIRAMLGGVELEQIAAPRESGPLGEPLLEVRDLRAPGVSLDHLRVHAGEIVGLAGLVGSGRTRLLRALAGADPVDGGAMALDGRTVRWPASPTTGTRLGIALAPEDRKAQGLVLDRPAAWNVALGRFGTASRGGPVRLSRLTRWARAGASAVGFSPERLRGAAGELSGGNQQKLVLARWLSRPVRCLLLDEPTRGIDIGAKAQIFETTRRIAAEGRAVVWSSSDLDEVVSHSDRVLVVASGRVVAELPAGCSVHQVLEIAFAAGTASTGASGAPNQERTAA
ncbi:sugar ABC transporter ATP-binding protein [Herbiconiux sp. YIM B11900]|uniref:sugar ABC transporter ATP-binding protein n=1 Tax=Herbiconiux sp. YIM B11900 TaxID=3404131 RepID=UPI003F8563E2